MKSTVTDTFCRVGKIADSGTQQLPSVKLVLPNFKNLNLNTHQQRHTAYNDKGYVLLY